MASYESFLPYVMPHVIGAPEPLALQAIGSSVIELCEKSMILTRDHDPVTVIANVVDYDLEPPTGYLVVKVMKAWLDNIKLDPAAPDFVADAGVYNRLYSSYSAGPSTPRAYVQKDPRSISLWPVADKKYANGLTMRVALKPTRAAESVEDEIFEEYVETVAAGAIARLMLMPEKPFTNAQGSVVQRAQFMQGLNVARSRALHGHSRSNLSVQLRKI